MGVETSKGISNQNTSLRGTSGPIEPGSASFSKLVETWESQTTPETRAGGAGGDWLVK